MQLSIKELDHIRRVVYNFIAKGFEDLEHHTNIRNAFIYIKQCYLSFNNGFRLVFIYILWGIKTHQNFLS